MITLRDWELNKEKWLDQDLSLMQSDEGWRERTQKNGINIWQRSFSDDKNDLFRWRIPKIEAAHSEVYDVFVNKMIEYHHYWTAEYTGGFLVKELEEDVQIIYQQFNPGIPLFPNATYFIFNGLEKLMKLLGKQVLNPSFLMKCRFQKILKG
jgi:hypothetical protein